ncbi:MAG: hypothetical protein K9M75_02130 [Phycisphaerae bacterium]|nr:hypothetical protein [Phycisphaerae bacterium]
MVSKKRVGIVAAVFVLFMCVSAYSAWTEPMHLGELNGPEFAATRPRVSSDGSIVYFVGKVGGVSNLWEAQKNEETGLYGQKRAVSEIGNMDGELIYGVWLSEDSHRMYNCWSDYDILGLPGWERVISMAVRENSSQPWQQTKNHFELQQSHTYLSSVSLTSDELNIMWTAQPEDYQNVVPTIFTASRSSVEDDFSDIRPMTELDEIGANAPYLSANGLDVYFEVANDDGSFSIWKGRRDSLDEPFGDFKELSDIINMPGTKSLQPCITPDGKALYFYRGSKEMDPAQKGIYVSYWVDTPLETAIKNIRKAIAMKKMAIRKINISIAPETAAIQALEEMLENPDLPAWKRRDVMRSKIILEQGIHEQIMARKELFDKIESLKKSIELLLQEKPEVNTGNGTRPRTPIQLIKPRPTVVPKLR